MSSYRTLSIVFVGICLLATSALTLADTSTPVRGADGNAVLTVLPGANVTVTASGEATVNLGTVTALGAGNATGSVTLRNDTGKPQLIGAVQASCGCTTPEISPDADQPPFTLPPGGQFVLKSTVNLLNLMQGPIEKSVWVYGGVQNDPLATIRLTGTLTGFADFSPMAVDFGKVRDQSAHSEDVSVHVDPALAALAPTLTLVSSDPEILVSPVPDEPKPATVAQPLLAHFRVSLATDIPIGLFSATLSIAVPPGHPELANALSSLTLQVYGEVLGNISAQPAVIGYGAIDQGQEAERSATIYGDTPGVLDGIKATADGSYIAVATKPVPAQGKRPASVLVTCRLLKTAPPGALVNKVTVTDKAGERIVLPLYVFVAPKTRV